MNSNAVTTSAKGVEFTKKTIGLSSRISSISMLGKSIEEGSKKKNDIQKDLFKKYKGDPKVIVNEQ